MPRAHYFKWKRKTMVCRENPSEEDPATDAKPKSCTSGFFYKVFFGGYVIVKPYTIRFIGLSKKAIHPRLLQETKSSLLHGSGIICSMEDTWAHLLNHRERLNTDVYLFNLSFFLPQTCQDSVKKLSLEIPPKIIGY
ncbi:unnamed protein product [Lepeophtheirus salmonis]|uniref:(salmon louse) hypothetical protein n=1 Tax=Lepeophtheirus salmonis TaxID=72036 RepID=A0A7R8CKV1_LEPSM|nr:unnamed protein product [Lepeophtheirus salmonis]CAF2850264.1 unnamed protein product [Lepeophtheirus salmonis]